MNQALISYRNSNDFLADANDFLYQREVQNNLTIGLLENNKNRPELLPNEMLCAYMEDNIVKATIFNSGYKVIVSCPQPTHAIVEAVYHQHTTANIPMNGYIGDLDFVNMLLGFEVNRKMQNREMYVQQLVSLNSIKCSHGAMLPATLEDLAIITEWSNLFQEEANNFPKHSIATLEKMNKNRIENNAIYKWVLDDEIVSIAAIVRQTKNTAIIGLVYTPVYYRNKGFATTIVHSLSNKILSSGLRFAGLFSDAGNPTSNSIYAKIGYQKIGVFKETFYLP